MLTFLTLPFCTNFRGVFCVFYDNYVRLCNSISKSPSAVAVELGLKKATVTRWKKGGNPTDANLQKIAVYFGVSTDYLLGKESEQKERPLINNDEELTEYLEELRERSDMRMLFSVTKNATKEQVMAIVKMIEEMQGK